ncbi:MAG: hypothetical protein KDH88_04895 [Chromatiales bacterium]|nr:hypothetical protein [Chromatiales bacterium]
MKTLLLITCCLALVACQPAYVRSHSALKSGDDLMRWVDQTLAPELAERLAASPKFRDQSLLIVKFRGERPSPSMDALTERVRVRIRDHLLRQSGIRLLWQPPARLIDADRRPTSDDCRGLTDVSYLLGIDLQVQGSDELRLSVRLLDPLDQRWVSGFAWAWSGTASDGQLKALTQDGPDESLRGLRELPFEANETDRLARYLADRLDCRLRRGGTGELTVSLAPSDEALAGLLRNYLAQGGVVRVTGNEAAAQVRLAVQRHPVDTDLDQLWVVATARDEVSPASLTLSAYQRKVLPRQPEARQAAVQQDTVEAFNTVAFDDGRNCQGCRELRVALARDAWLFVLRLAPDDQAELVFPHGCDAEVGPAQRAGNFLRIRDASSPEYDEASRYYAIAITDEAVAGRMVRLTRRLPGACGRQRGLSPAGQARWLAELTRLEVENRPWMEWRRLAQDPTLARDGGWQQ